MSHIGHVILLRLHLSLELTRILTPNAASGKALPEIALADAGYTAYLF
jgi:hypothetical protein